MCSASVDLGVVYTAVVRVSRAAGCGGEGKDSSCEGGGGSCPAC